MKTLTLSLLCLAFLAHSAAYAEDSGNGGVKAAREAHKADRAAVKAAKEKAHASHDVVMETVAKRQAEKKAKREERKAKRDERRAKRASEKKNG
jgi:hypothetical protein